MSGGSKEVQVRIVYAAEWVEYVTVQVPPGTTRREGQRLVASVVDGRTARPPADAEVHANDVEILGTPEWAKPSTAVVVPVSEDFWLEWDGSRWCTDGAIILREGSPMPSAMFEEWDEVRPWRRIKDIDRNRALDILLTARRVRAEVEAGAEYHERFAPVFDGAEVRRGPKGGTAFGFYSAAVFRDGRLVAVVMPLSRHHGLPAIDCHGKATAKPEAVQP